MLQYGRAEDYVTNLMEGVFSWSFLRTSEFPKLVPVTAMIRDAREHATVVTTDLFTSSHAKMPAAHR